MSGVVRPGCVGSRFMPMELIAHYGTPLEDILALGRWDPRVIGEYYQQCKLANALANIGRFPSREYHFPKRSVLDPTQLPELADMVEDAPFQEYHMLHSQLQEVGWRVMVYIMPDCHLQTNAAAAQHVFVWLFIPTLQLASFARMAYSLSWQALHVHLPALRHTVRQPH